MSEPDPRPSIAELTQAALGDAPLVAPRPTPVETSMRKVYLATAGLVVVLGVAVGGLVYRFHQDRLFHSDDPDISFSKPDAEEEKRFQQLEYAVAQPDSGVVLRLAHVTYRQDGNGPGVPGLAAEMKAKGIDDGLDLLPGVSVVEPEPLLGGRFIGTGQVSGAWIQVTAAKDKLFLARGSSRAETLAILGAMLRDEGIDVPHQGEGA